MIYIMGIWNHYKLARLLNVLEDMGGSLQKRRIKVLHFLKEPGPMGHFLVILHAPKSMDGKLKKFKEWGEEYILSGFFLHGPWDEYEGLDEKTGKEDPFKLLKKLGLC